MTTLKDVDKLAVGMEKFKKKCSKCGHTLFIAPIRPKRLCRWCGTMNYYDGKTEFKEKVKNALKK